MYIILVLENVNDRWNSKARYPMKPDRRTIPTIIYRQDLVLVPQRFLYRSGQ